MHPPSLWLHVGHQPHTRERESITRKGTSKLSGQACFRKYNNTIQQLELLTSAIEDARLTGQNIYALMVNMIDHDTLFKIMNDPGFPPDALSVLRPQIIGTLAL